MAARFLAPDLTQLLPAKLLEEVEFEVILAAQKQYVLDRWDDVRTTRPDLPPLTTLGLETEPMTIVLETYAYREMLLRALVNDKARAVMLAYSTGTDLDHLGVRFGVERMPLVAEPRSYSTNPEDWESDDRLRRRIQLAPEAFSTAGARGAYIFHALTFDVSIADAWAFSPKEGRVHVAVAGADGADVSDDILAGLIDRFARDEIVPLTDAVTVRRAVRRAYAIVGTLLMEPGPDPAAVRAEAEAALQAYAALRATIHSTVYLSGLTAAGKVGAAESFVLAMPTSNVIAGDAEIPHLTSVTLTVNELE